MQNTISAIRDMIEQAEKMKGAYFFRPPTSARERRSYERYNSRPLIEWEEGGHTYTARLDVSCSCANVYARCEYTRDGKKTTITAIRNSLRRMEADQA